MMIFIGLQTIFYELLVFGGFFIFMKNRRTFKVRRMRSHNFTFVGYPTMKLNVHRLSNRTMRMRRICGLVIMFAGLIPLVLAIIYFCTA